MKLFYCPPNTQQIFTLSEKDGLNQVTFTDFEAESEITFKGNIQAVSPAQVLNEDLSTSKLNLPEFHAEQQSQADYIQSVNQIISFLKENKIPKLVFSRLKFCASENIAIGQTFLNICAAYPNAFCWWFSHKGESWLGATPEILGKFDKNDSSFETMSLAGTLPLEEEWTEKEKEEQKPVTDYILQILKRYSPDVSVSPVYDHISGNIKHLRNDFHAIINPESLEDLVAELHPTPAVCGVPKEFCQNAIKEFESHPRELYAGYITIDDGRFITCFVNLRCAKLYKNGALLYAGGGITSQSNPDKEWRETELKMQAVATNLA